MPVVFALVVVAGAGAALWWASRDAESGDGMGATVFHRERASGADARLLRLLDQWTESGSHDVLVAPDGGVRDAAKQQALYEQGRALDAAGSWRVVDQSRVVTNAQPHQAPHVHRGALDVWPVAFVPSTPWAQQPERIKAQFAAFGEFAERHGFTWGGRWLKAMPPYGDQPHVEVPDWNKLPIPSENVS